MDRDGHQGWSRRSEAAWQRIFGPKQAGRRAATKHAEALRRLSRMSQDLEGGYR